MGNNRPLKFGRRWLLIGVFLAGCSRIFVQELPDQDIVATPVTTPNVLKIVIFELSAVELPFHAGMIIHTPDTRLIFDPLGDWTSDDCHRDGEIIRDPSPQAEAQYLARSGLAIERLGWTLHLFETPVTAQVASQAITLIEASAPTLPLHCAFEVSSILAQLPGFDFVDPNLLTADLYRALRSQPEIEYTRRVIN